MATAEKSSNEPAGFPAGTLVHTKDGHKPIEKIQASDLVLSKHESGRDGREYKRVTKTFAYSDRELIKVGYRERQRDGADLYQEILVTPEQPVWVKNKGWKDAFKVKHQFPFLNLEVASDLEARVTSNVRLFATGKANVAWAPISSASESLSSAGSHYDVLSQSTLQSGVFVDFDFVRSTHRAKPEHVFRATVYNFEVEEFQTYHVGMSGVLVHNNSTK